MNHKAHKQQRSPQEEEQARVDALFDADRVHWTELYERRDAFSAIMQQRRATALEFFDGLRLPGDSPVLEVGCGAGLTSVELARRGYSVQSIDGVPAMVDLCRKHALEAGLGDRVRAETGDVHSLRYPDGSFAVVLALGVVPWLHSLEAAAAEISRVLVPGGYVIISADNPFRLNDLLDPAHMPASAPLVDSLRRALVRGGLKKPTGVQHPHVYRVKAFERVLAMAGLRMVKQRQFGFGPFTFLNRPVLSEVRGVKVHEWLQELADRRLPLLRSLSSQYVVVARKVGAVGGLFDDGHSPDVSEIARQPC